MDGVTIVRALLADDAGVTTLVPPARIVAGALGLGSPLDAISITRISSVDRNIPTPGATRRATERVQVMALAATYPRQKEILRAAKRALADFVGSVVGTAEVAIRTDHAGPDFMDNEASIYIGTQDFFVGFSEPR